MKSVTILGATGSIGRSAIAFLRLHRDKFNLVNIAVGSNWMTAQKICAEFGCRRVSFANAEAAAMFAQNWPYGGIKILSGKDAATELAAHPVDVVLAAMSGAEGLPPIIAAIKAGNRIALANKEALVCCGAELLALASQQRVDIIPVDSEHSAIFQSLLAGKRDEVASLLLTASGGPFRTATMEEMRCATREAALNHPNWSMGAKNTIDSATLANKGLELIEAAYLFNCVQQEIEVLINPSSVLHSAVSFRDGSMIAQLGIPDMRVAVGYGLSWPDRLATGVDAISLGFLGSLRFEEVDAERFPALSLARLALDLTPDGPLVFNAANEVAVAAFLNGEIGFTEIPEIIEKCLERGAGRFLAPLEDIPAVNVEAQLFCRSELLPSQRCLLRH